jgi:hypothetical protein
MLLKSAVKFDAIMNCDLRQRAPMMAAAGVKSCCATEQRQPIVLRFSAGISTAGTWSFV